MRQYTDQLKERANIDCAPEGRLGGSTRFNFRDIATEAASQDHATRDQQRLMPELVSKQRGGL